MTLAATQMLCSTASPATVDDVPVAPNQLQEVKEHTKGLLAQKVITES